MKKLAVVFSILLVSQFAFAGVEFIGVDGANTTFVANSGLLSMSGNPLVITIDYDDATPQSYINPGTFDLSTTLVTDMHFEGGTFEFTDTTNTLLSGTVTAIDFEFTSFGYLVGSGIADVLVENLDGDLLGDAEIITITFNIEPPVTNFDEDFEGLSKVNFLVPEPATLSLLALGGLALRRRRKA
jgi:hypothetical protein